MDGFFKVHRKILDSQVFAHQTALKIWIWCLAKVTFKERFVSLKVGKGETTIKLNPGQFIFGRFKAEEELNIDGSTIYKWMQKFSTKEFDMITIKSNNQYSIITLNNWERYNIINGNEEQPCNNCVTTAEQPCNNCVTTAEQLHNNCVTQTRKIKKDNNIIYNNFYDSEIEKSEGNQNYLKFIKILFGENNLGIPLTSVLKMEQQVTYEQFKKLWYLKEKYKFSITDVLERMENWKKINGNKTVYKTFLTFIKRENPAIIIG